MTPTVNNKTGAFEKLLRAHIKESGSICSGFDADFAAAYLEKTITAGAAQRYERHLIECASCRTTVAQLALMDETDSAAARADQNTVKFFGARLSLTGLLAGLATPKWALAGLALLVAIISVPVIMNLNAPKRSVAFRDEAESAAVSAESAESNSSRQPYQYASNPASAQNAQVKQAPAAAKPASVKPEPGSPANGVDALGAGAVAQPAAGDVASREGDKKADGERASAAASRDEQAKTEQPASRAAENREETAGRKGSNERTDLPKIDPARALSVPEEKSRGAEVKTLKRGNGDDTKKEQERTATVKPIGELAPRPSDAAGSDGRARTGISAPPPPLHDKDTKAKAAAVTPATRDAENSGTRRGGKPEERRVSNKTFRLLSGVWTDKGYKADKEIPVVPLVWDTDVYKEMLVKQAGLKLYFSGFKNDERVVLVYKGAIYKLAPPEK